MLHVGRCIEQSEMPRPVSAYPVLNLLRQPKFEQLTHASGICFDTLYGTLYGTL